jgi:tetratricopeptide (TPR) repeat protein
MIGARLLGGILLGWIVVAGAGGCAGHSARTKTARDALDRGAPWAAIDSLNEQLEVERADQVPVKLDADDALLLLGRGSVLQQVARYSFSSRDFEVADKQIELLDFSRDGLDDLGRYLYSDDTGPYKAPAYEKLLINTLNMVNYLARNDLSGARVEARRFATMRAHLRDRTGKGELGDAAGNYLAGLVFELSGNRDEARVFYTDALAALPAGEWRDQVQEQLNALSKTADCEYAEGCGTLVLFAGTGRVAPKESKRIPIGLALTYAALFLSPRYTHLAGQGLVTWINYPELGRARLPIASPQVTLNQQAVALGQVMNIDAVSRVAWRQARGAIVASAIIRTISRALAGEATRQAVGGTLGAIISLGGQAALTAADTPDTRSWSALPASVYLTRRTVKAGDYTIDAQAQGVRERRKVRVAKDGWAFVPFIALR